MGAFEDRLSRNIRRARRSAADSQVNSQTVLVDGMLHIMRVRLVVSASMREIVGTLASQLLARRSSRILMGAIWLHKVIALRQCGDLSGHGVNEDRPRAGARTNQTAGRALRAPATPDPDSTSIASATGKRNGQCVRLARLSSVLLFQSYAERG